MHTALLSLCCISLLLHVSWACKVSLRQVARVKTQGNAGFEFMVLSSDDQGPQSLLATANFWDGKNHDMR